MFVINFVPFKNPIFSTHFYLGVWLLAWLLSPFWLSFFSLRSPLSPPSCFSSVLNSVNLWVFWAVKNTYGIDHWLDLSLSFWFPLLSSWPPLSPSSLFSSLCNSMNISEASRLWGAHREVITGYLALSSFDSPYSPPGHLYFPPPSSPCNSVHFSRCPSLWRNFTSLTYMFYHQCCIDGEVLRLL